MTARESPWPPQEEANDILSRLLADDPVAPSDLAVAFLNPLARWLERTNPRVDSHVCATAAEDAILALIKNPKSFSPARQSLEVYLRMSAVGDLRNALRSEARHRDRRASLAVVELLPDDRKSWWESSDPAAVVERSIDLAALEDAMEHQPVPESVRVGLTTMEAKVLELMRLGERNTLVFAEALGVQHLSIAEQRREAKRAKDRLKRRIARAGGSGG